MNRTSLPLTCLPISKFFSLITSFIFWCVKVQKELPCVTGSVIGKRTISMNASEYPGTETRNSLEKDHGMISSPGCLLTDLGLSKRRCSFRTLSYSVMKQGSEDLLLPGILKICALSRLSLRRSIRTTLSGPRLLSQFPFRGLHPGLWPSISGRQYQSPPYSPPLEGQYPGYGG